MCICFVCFLNLVYKEQGVCSLKKHLAHLVSYYTHKFVNKSVVDTGPLYCI